MNPFDHEDDEDEPFSSPAPHSQDDFTARILAHIASLPLHEQADAIHRLVSGAMKEMPSWAINELRSEISSQFPADVPIVESTLELIDGQLALRQIAGNAKWR